MNRALCRLTDAINDALAWPHATLLFLALVAGSALARQLAGRPGWQEWGQWVSTFCDVLNVVVAFAIHSAQARRGNE